MPDPAARVAASTHHDLADAHRRLADADDAIIRAQIAVSQIAAPTGEEEERAIWVERRFHDAGLTEVHRDAAGNVVGRRGAPDAAPVVVCAHLDTVFPRDTDLTVRRAGGRLIGPGINDNGRGLAAMLALTAAIDGAHVRPACPVEFVATTGEEGAGDLRGAKHYFDTRGAAAVAAVVVDGAGDERIVHRALGSRRFRVEFAGPGGHSWAAYGAPNAVHAAGAATSRIAGIRLPVTPRTTLTVSRIGGGLSINSIPEAAWLEVDLRSTSATVLDMIAVEIEQASRAARDDENHRRAPGSPALQVTITAVGHRPCGETPDAHPLVRASAEATRLVGRRPDLALASTDANVPIARGIPAIAIGAGGRGGDAHTLGEWFDNVHGTLGIARAMTIILAAARL